MNRIKQEFIDRDDVCPGCGRTVSELREHFLGWAIYNVVTIDHLLPKSLGGQRVFDNVDIVCYECNQARQNQYPWDWWGDQFLVYQNGHPQKIVKLTYSCSDCGQETRNLERHKHYCSQLKV